LKDKDYLLKKASTLMGEGKYLHALQHYISLQEQNIFDREVAIGLITLYEKLNLPEAISKTAYKFEPFISKDSSLYNLLMFALINNHQLDTAEKIVDKGLESKLKNYFKGIISFNQNDYEIAAINFTEFVRKNKKSNYVPEALYLLAESYLQLKRFDECYQIGKEAIYFLADDDRVKTLLAEVCFELGMIETALSYFRSIGKTESDRYLHISKKLNSYSA
jgi:tetratricopeptide (TPR) repeat protein